MNFIKLKHPVALRRSAFAFHFFVVYVQHRLIFSRHLLFIVTYMFRPNQPASGVQVVVRKAEHLYSEQQIP
jgi:hypothetical protein